MTRVRNAAQRAPQSLEAATALLVRFAEIDSEAALIEAVRADAIGRANAAADAQLVPLIAAQKDVSKQLQPWWEASVDALTGGKRKSIELGGCIIGYRVTPPKVVFAHGKDDAATAALIAAELTDLVRVKSSPDKPAILKGLDGGLHHNVLIDLGFSAVQKEEFFVDRVGSALALADVPN